MGRWLLISLLLANPVAASEFCSLVFNSTSIFVPFKTLREPFRSMAAETTSEEKAQVIARLRESQSIDKKRFQKIIKVIADESRKPTSSVHVITIAGMDRIYSFFKELGYRPPPGQVDPRTKARTTILAMLVLSRLPYFIFNEEGSGVIGPLTNEGKEIMNYVEVAFVLGTAWVVDKFFKDKAALTEYKDLPGVLKEIDSAIASAKPFRIHGARGFGWDHLDMIISGDGSEINLDIIHWRGFAPPRLPRVRK